MAYPQSIGSVSHDRLRAGCTKPEVTRAGIILANELALTRGAVLGRVAGAATAAAAAGNTGNGVMGAVTVGRHVQDGKQYRVVITAASANAGTFELRAPDGSLVKTGTVAVAFTSDHLNFTLADGATDFVVGDTFIISVAMGTKYRHVNSANTDGSAIAQGVLLADVAASVSDTSHGVAIAFEGEFNEAALTFGGTDTLAMHRGRLHDIGCYLRKSQDVNGLG